MYELVAVPSCQIGEVQKDSCEPRYEQVDPEVALVVDPPVGEPVANRDVPVEGY